MYKIAICDDDKRYRKTIREIIEHENSLPENEIRFYEYESGNELLKHTDILHELVFIDIRMPGLDGNQTALKLRNYNKDAVLIFYSSYFEPTVDSINFGQPFRYIMKDLHDTSLRREIAAIMTEVKRRFLNDYAVTVTSAGKIIRIHVENILNKKIVPGIYYATDIIEGDIVLGDLPKLNIDLNISEYVMQEESFDDEFEEGTI